ALLEIAGHDDDEVRPEAADLLLHRALRAVANGDHDDHRADTDHDAEHREHRAHLVLRDALRGELEERGLFHAASFIPVTSSADSAARSSAARRRCSTGWSRTIRPSRTSTTRVAYCATSGSCVTSRMVIPWSLSFWKSAITSMEVRLSRLPVGS